MRYELTARVERPGSLFTTIGDPHIEVKEIKKDGKRGIARGLERIKGDHAAQAFKTQ